MKIVPAQEMQVIIGHRSAYGNTRKNRIARTLGPLITHHQKVLSDLKKQCQTAWEETLVPLKGLPFWTQGAIGKG